MFQVHIISRCGFSFTVKLSFFHSYFDHAQLNYIIEHVCNYVYIKDKLFGLCRQTV